MKGQKALAQSLDAQRQQNERHYQEDRARMLEKSPIIKAREEEYLAHQAWKAGHDYRKPPPGLLSLDYADPAQRQRMRERIFNPGMNTPTGIAGLAGSGMDSVAVQNTMAVMKDEQDRDAASQYESDVRAEDAYQRGENSTFLANYDLQKNSTLLGSSANMAQFYTSARIQAQPQPILPSILGGLIGAAGTALGGPIGGAIASRIGGGLTGGGAAAPGFASRGLPYGPMMG